MPSLTCLLNPIKIWGSDEVARSGLPVATLWICLGEVAHAEKHWCCTLTSPRHPPNVNFWAFTWTFSDFMQTLGRARIWEVFNLRNFIPMLCKPPCLAHFFCFVRLKIPNHLSRSLSFEYQCYIICSNFYSLFAIYVFMILSSQTISAKFWLEIDYFKDAFITLCSLDTTFNNMQMLAFP